MPLTPYLIMVIVGFAAFGVALFATAIWSQGKRD